MMGTEIENVIKIESESLDDKFIKDVLEVLREYLTASSNAGILTKIRYRKEKGFVDFEIEQTTEKAQIEEYARMYRL